MNSSLGSQAGCPRTRFAEVSAFNMGQFQREPKAVGQAMLGERTGHALQLSQSCGGT